MRIDRRLNLVIPIEREDGSTIYVHSAPVSRDIFELFFLPISRAFNQIYTNQLNVTSGPRVAALMLKSVAKQMGIWEGPGGVEAGLVAEIKRLCNVVMPGPQGWTTLPLFVAQQQGLLSEDEIAEVDGVATFFTLNYLMHKKSIHASVWEAMSLLWETQTSSLSPMEFAGSLTTLSVDVSTGEMETVSSVPS
jgi:hypothetical protein